MARSVAEVLSDVDLTMAEFDRLGDVLRDLNHSMADFQAILDSIEVEKRQRRVESLLGIPVTPQAVAYLRSRQVRVETTLAAS